MDAKDTEMGPCCRCGKSDEPARCIIMLPFKAPVPGHGWGCVQCGQPQDGAIAVICDRCEDPLFRPDADLRWACRGFPAKEGRIPYLELAGHHDHDITRHPELPAADMYARLKWFDDSPLEGDPGCICSACVKPIMDFEESDSDLADFDDDEGIAIRMWNDHQQEMRFHVRCFSFLTDRGVLTVTNQ